MNENQNDNLEHALKELSWWTGPTPKLWKRAARAIPSRERKGAGLIARLQPFLKSRWPWIGTPIAAVIVAAVWLANHPSASHPPEQAGWEDGNSSITVASGVTQHGWSNWGVNNGEGQHWNEAAYGYQRPGALGRGEGKGAQGQAEGEWKLPIFGDVPATRRGRDAVFGTDGPSGDQKGKQVPQSGGGPTAAYGRQVIRRSAIDLRTDDVRGIYLKVQTLVPLEAQGEYIEQSQITGSDKELEGNITLRVQGERLGQVFNTLRGLAEVTREQNEASDVTTQVVDVDARLRNERRIEKELLELLDKRNDAPLEDVLKVRESLSSVRERIEQLTGQQQALAKQVALAIVLVTIRQKDAPPPPVPVVESFGQRLGKKIADAWSAGLDMLGTSVAAIMQVIVGGLVFWVGLIVVIWLLRKWYLRRSA